MTFNAERWAEAYIASCKKLDEDPAAGLSLLETVTPFLRRIPGGVPASYAASCFSGFVKLAAEKTSISGVKSAQALLYILIKKGRAEKAMLLNEKLSQLIDEINGIVRIKLEIASESEKDSGFLKDFADYFIKENNAAGVKIETTVKPALLGGFRWTCGSVRADYSIAGSLSRLCQSI